MTNRILEISAAPARLSIENRQLVIASRESGETRIPCQDIAVLILDRPDISLTQPVLRELSDVGAVLISCDLHHQPHGIMLPLSGHWAGTERARFQMDASKPLGKRIWQKIVQRKIMQQSTVVMNCTGKSEGLDALSGRVRSGDPDNLEAQAAQRYWPALMGKDFRRRRDGDPPNNLLNYGYAILRAAVARSIVGVGLLPSLGVKHHNRTNAFCLADDLMEPYRPFVDHRVVELIGRDDPARDISKRCKQALLGIFQERIRMNGPRHDGDALALMNAIRVTAATVASSFESGVPDISLPIGLFVEERPSNERG